MTNRTKALCLAIAEATIDQAIAEHEEQQLARAIAASGPNRAGAEEAKTFEQHFAAAMAAEAGKKAS